MGDSPRCFDQGRDADVDFESEPGSSSVDASDDYDLVCTRCGNLFLQPSSGHTYDGDRCDTCASPHHPECLRTHHDLRGEWSLCKDCIETRIQDGVSIVGDFRRLPKSFWQRLHGKFSTGVGDAAQAAKPESGGDAGNTARMREEVS